MAMVEKLIKNRDLQLSSTARKRIEMLLDEASFVEIGALRESRDKTVEVITGYGTVYGMPVYVFAQNPEIDGGAMSVAHAAKISAVYDLAFKTGSPVVGIFDSVGARLDDGIGVLSALSDLLLKSNNLSGVVPQIAVVSGVCAASSAMLATASDVLLMTEDAELFLNPPFNSVKGNSGSAYDAVKNGTAHILSESDEDAMQKVRQLLSMLPDNNISPVMSTEPGLPDGGCPYCDLIDAGSAVVVGDGFGEFATTAIARINGASCGVINCKTGEDGLLDSDSCSKITRFVRFCDAFSIPIVTLVDVVGFSEDNGSELKAAAALSHAYSEATTVKISVITERAYGTAFVALCGKAANADLVLAFPDSIVSPVDPITAASVVYNERIAAGESREKLEREYITEKASAFAAARVGAVDDIILPEEIRAKVACALSMLSSKRVETLPKKHSNMPL